MATKGSKLQRAIGYFREAPLDEMRVAFQLTKEVVDERLAPTQPKLKFTRKPRTKRTAVVGSVTLTPEQASAINNA